MAFLADVVVHGNAARVRHRNDLLRRLDVRAGGRRLSGRMIVTRSPRINNSLVFVCDVGILADCEGGSGGRGGSRLRVLMLSDAQSANGQFIDLQRTNPRLLDGQTPDRNLTNRQRTDGDRADRRSSEQQRRYAGRGHDLARAHNVERHLRPRSH